MSLHTRLTRSATVLLAATVVLALFALPATSMGIGSSLGARANPAEEAAPSGLLFVENAGQWPAGARFQVWGGPGTMWLSQDAIWITVVEEAKSRNGVEWRGQRSDAGIWADPTSGFQPPTDERRAAASISS